MSTATGAMLGVTYAVFVGVAMVVSQYLFCRCWFSSHQRGPLEGLWRRLTWVKAEHILH